MCWRYCSLALSQKHSHKQKHLQYLPHAPRWRDATPVHTPQHVSQRWQSLENLREQHVGDLPQPRGPGESSLAAVCDELWWPSRMFSEWEKCKRWVELFIHNDHVCINTSGVKNQANLSAWYLRKLAWTFKCLLVYSLSLPDLRKISGPDYLQGNHVGWSSAWSPTGSLKSHLISKLRCYEMYRQVSNISRTRSRRFSYCLAAFFDESLEARCQVKNEDIVGAAPTGDAPTTSGWSTILLSTKVRLILEVLR